MKSLYLYKKFSEDGKSVISLAEDFVTKDDRAFAVTEHDRKFDELDNVILNGIAGDVIIVESLHDLGTDNKEMIKRIKRIINKRISLLSCDFSGTYTHGISADVNNLVLETVVEMLNKADGNSKKLIFHPKGAGRPGVDFPDGWDDKYKEWESKKISSKDFMDWSGMKKATFYNKLTEYRELLDQEEEYKNNISVM